MKQAINIKKGRKATTNEAIKFAFIQVVKDTAEELKKDRIIEFDKGAKVEILDDDLHHIEKVLNAFITKYKECDDIRTGRIKTVTTFEEE